MMTIFPKTYIAAVALAVASAPAAAQVTPEAYLAELEALYELQGLSFSYQDVRESGDGLVIDGIVLGLSMPTATMELNLGSMSIRPTVVPGFDLELEASPEIGGSIVIIDPIEGEIPIEVTVRAPGVAWVGGDGAPRKLEMAYPEIFVTYSMKPEGADGPVIGMMAKVQDVAGAVQYDLAAESQNFQILSSGMSVDLELTDPEGPTVEILSNHYDVGIGGRGVLVDVTDTGAAFNVASESALTSSSSETKITASEDGVPVVIDLRSGPSDISATTGQGGFDYALSSADVAVDVSGDALPLPPVSATISNMAGRLAMPIVPAEEMGPFALGLRLEDLAVSDLLWNMIDPGGALSRDPATVIVEAEAEARALVDMSSGEPGPFAGTPWEFGAFSISEVRASVAGAEVTANGSGVVDNNGPFPMPVGALDVRLVGVTSLMATLSELGLLSPEQAMPAQMVLGMFAKPTGEPDTFESRIEAGADGSITANGIPLQ